MYQIESNIKAPVRNKMKKKAEEARQRVFRRYANAYEVLNISRPDRHSYDAATDLMTIYRGNSVCERASPKRIEAVTRMMRNRIQDRA